MECSLCYNGDYKFVFDVYRVVFWRYENKRRDQPYSIVLLLYLLWPSPDNTILPRSGFELTTFRNRGFKHAQGVPRPSLVGHGGGTDQCFMILYNIDNIHIY